MDILNLLGTTLGLGLAAGLRLYATVLALGVALRMEWLTLPSELAPLQVLAHPAVLAVAGVMYVMEFVTDKVPWLDSAWDAAHTVIRPLGAAGLALTAFGQMDPAARVGLALLCGGVALSSHATKAATRLAVNQSPEPVSNAGLSLLGDAAVPAFVWFTMEHPVLTLVVSVVVLVVFFWILTRIVKLLRSGWAALRRRWSTA
ncbi:MAG TPA: DUF4126 domain-containing protein [Bryobacteraceae bacterium]|nr:DUF4126 domain-containing protein [Bryobacterales bacterium]HRJ19001.1 DUF4126 domain-containing protein [Bryobacteraceae bacterium]